VVREGKDVCIFAYGSSVSDAMGAATMLEQQVRGRRRRNRRTGAPLPAAPHSTHTAQHTHHATPRHTPHSTHATPRHTSWPPPADHHLTSATQGVSATVVDARFCKPLDTALLRRCAREHAAMITVEEGSIGGFAAHVMQFLALEGLLDGGLKFRPMTLPDRCAQGEPLCAGGAAGPRRGARRPGALAGGWNPCRRRVRPPSHLPLAPRCRPPLPPGTSSTARTRTSWRRRA
jgi:hypothetical protein